MIDKINPNPRDMRTRGINNNGVNIIPHPKLTFSITNTIATAISRIKNSSKASEIDDITRATLGKFTRVTRLPASTRDLVDEIKILANSNQMLIFSSAYERYGIGVSPTLMIRRLVKYEKTMTANTGGMIIHR